MAYASDCCFTSVLDTGKTGRSFETENDAFLWAQQVSNALKFNITRSTRKLRYFDPLRDENLYHHYFTCECAERKEKAKKPVVKKRRTSSKRVGCEFRGVIRLTADGFFHIILFEGCHAHPLIYYVEGNPIYTRLTPADILKIEEMARAHCKPKVIVEALQYAEPRKPYVRKGVYNRIFKLKKDAGEGRNPARQFFHLARENHYVTRVSVQAGTEMIKDLFWSHPDARNLLRTYSKVFCIDSTYGTNKYNYALVEIVGVTPTNQNFIAGQALLQHEDKEGYLWALQCFSDLLGEVHPEVIVTDRELGLFEPIQRVFPKSHHMLCMFHVQKMVRTRAMIILDNQKEADALCYGHVTKMFEAPTLEDFEENELLLRTKYGWVPGFMKYLDETWMPHKEKICFAWTNNVRHFGNTTTNRVESAHSALKSWMSSCKGGIDTLFKQAHSEIKGQVSEIKCMLQWSRSKNLYGFDCSPYMSLLRVVSHYCLKLLETERMKKEDCTHALRSTHGLPCQCQLEILSKGGSIDPGVVDAFWSTLAFDGEEAEVQLRRLDLEKLVREYEERDPADQLLMSQALQAQLYPDEHGYEEPKVNVTKRGRPSKKKAKTTRQLSHWEHVEKKFSGSSKVKSKCAEQLLKGIKDVPPFVRPYFLSMDDVGEDGNCGFRCVASQFLGSEDSYVSVRKMMVAEIRANRSVYEKLYGNNGEVDEAIQRIDWTGGKCSREHWMHTQGDLFVVAQIFRAVVSLYSCDKNERSESFTVFPWGGEIDEYQELKEFSIILRTSRLHFVVGNFSCDHPLPNLHAEWSYVRSRSLGHWEHVYGDRLERYKKMQSVSWEKQESQVPKKKRKAKFINLTE